MSMASTFLLPSRSMACFFTVLTMKTGTEHFQTHVCFDWLSDALWLWPCNCVCFIICCSSIVRNSCVKLLSTWWKFLLSTFLSLFKFIIAGTISNEILGQLKPQFSEEQPKCLVPSASCGWTMALESSHRKIRWRQPDFSILRSSLYPSVISIPPSRDLHIKNNSRSIWRLDLFNMITKTYSAYSRSWWQLAE